MWLMIPYFTFMTFDILFILSISSAGSEHKEGMERTKIVTLATLTLILWCYQVRQEIIQFQSNDSKAKYFEDFQNIGDIICLTLTPALCLTNYGPTPSMEVDTQSYLSAIVSFFLVFECFDWFNINESYMIIAHLQV